MVTAQVIETAVNEPMLKLTQQEQALLNDYQKATEEKHPGVVPEMLIYESKARGNLISGESHGSGIQQT